MSKIDINKIAEELASVQPMLSTAFSELHKIAETREVLQAKGYKPVSRFGLLWTKDDE